jgi:hypothetical protein
VPEAPEADWQLWSLQAAAATLAPERLELLYILFPSETKTKCRSSFASSDPGKGRAPRRQAVTSLSPRGPRLWQIPECTAGTTCRAARANTPCDRAEVGDGECRCSGTWNDLVLYTYTSFVPR